MGDKYDEKKRRDFIGYNLNFKFYGKVFLPYCFNNHWCLFILNIRDESITHYDPYGNILAANNNHEIETRFLEYLHRCKILDPNMNNLLKINWKIVKANPNVAHQSDIYNCGCYVIYYMDMNAKSSMNSKENFNPDCYRIEIAQFLIQILYL